MSGTFTNEVGLHVGDLIQVEGDVLLVECVGNKTADALPMELKAIV